MGVKGDASRTSVVVAEQPFMGLLPASQTKSWSEPVYAHAWSNSCWELYGVTQADQYPRSEMNFDMRVTVDAAAQGSFDWDASWHSQPMTCPGHPAQAIDETHSDARQDVTWRITPAPAAAALAVQ